jgi:hypothetical protein
MHRKNAPRSPLRNQCGSKHTLAPCPRDLEPAQRLRPLGGAGRGGYLAWVAESYMALEPLLIRLTVARRGAVTLKYVYSGYLLQNKAQDHGPEKTPQISSSTAPSAART